MSYRHVLSQLQCRVHNCHYSVVFTSSVCQQAHQAEPLFSPLQPGALGIITATDLSSPHWLQLGVNGIVPLIQPSRQWASLRDLFPHIIKLAQQPHRLQGAGKDPHQDREAHCISKSCPHLRARLNFQQLINP